MNHALLAAMQRVDGEAILGPAFCCVFAVFGIASFAFWIWMLVDCIQNEEDDQKVIWILVILLAGVVGAVIYFFVRRNR